MQEPNTYYTAVPILQESRSCIHMHSTQIQAENNCLLHCEYRGHGSAQSHEA